MFKLLGFILLLAPTMLHGQTGFTPCKDVATFKKQYAEASKKLATLRSTFVQEKSISMLKNKLVSHGEFCFKKKDKLRMEFTKPYSYLFILNGDKVFISDNQKQSEASTSSNKLFKKISQITISSVSGDILSSKEFTCQILESNSQYLLKLSPTSNEIKDFFRQFLIFISKNDHLVEKIEMAETSGDNTTITFKDKQVNIPLSDALFSLK